MLFNFQGPRCLVDSLFILAHRFFFVNTFSKLFFEVFCVGSQEPLCHALFRRSVVRSFGPLSWALEYNITSKTDCQHLFYKNPKDFLWFFAKEHLSFIQTHPHHTVLLSQTQVHPTNSAAALSTLTNPDAQSITHRIPPPAQRPLTHLPISTHNPPPNQQAKERAPAPRGYRPSLYERLKTLGVFRGFPPKRVFRAGPKWLCFLWPLKGRPVRRGQTHRKASSHKSSVWSQ